MLSVRVSHHSAVMYCTNTFNICDIKAPIVHDSGPETDLMALILTSLSIFNVFLLHIQDSCYSNATGTYGTK